MQKIDSKITGYEVVAADEPPMTLREYIKRPKSLVGCTYKVTTPLSDHSLYVTINDYVLNKGLVGECRVPFEIFINCKSMDNFQWIVALTRVISAVFRKGGDITFLVGELKAVFDPRGGYFKKGGKYMNSLVAEIGDVIETHLISIKVIPPEEKKDQFPEHATVCSKCRDKAVVKMDGCDTCMSCGEAKCG